MANSTATVSIIGHRGAAGLVEFENTLDSFEKAISLNIPFVEFDVRRTKDGKLVCHHDSSLDGIELAELDYDRLVTLSKDKGFEIPLLEETIEYCKGKIKLDIELKETGYEREVVDLIKQHLHYSEYIIKSFNDTSIKLIKEIDHQITTGLLLGKGHPQSIITRLLELFPEFRILWTSADFVSPNYHLLKLGFLWRMAFMKKNVYVWTVNDETLMVKLIKKRVHALITDRPDLAVKLLENLEKSQ